MLDSVALSVSGVPLQGMLGKTALALSWVDEVIVWTDKDGHIEWCNSAFERLVQQPLAAMAAQRLAEVLPLTLPLTLKGEPLVQPLHPVHSVLTTSQQHEGRYDFPGHDRTVTLALTIVPLPCTEANLRRSGVMLVARALATQTLGRSSESTTLQSTTPEPATLEPATLEPTTPEPEDAILTPQQHEPTQESLAQFAQITQQLKAAIAEHQQTETALRKSNECFRCIFDNASIAISLADAHTYHIVEANQAHRTLFGYSNAELAAMTHVDITHPDDVGTNLEQIKQLRDGVISWFQIEKRFVKKDGTWILATLTVSLIRESGGRTYSLGMIEDITDAIKYSPQGGKVQFALMQTPNTVAFEVQDYGIDIPQSDFAQLFDRFYRASNAPQSLEPIFK